MPKKHLIKLGGGEEYEGQLSSNVPQGFGRAKFKSGCSYRGTWLDGQFHGAGVMQKPQVKDASIAEAYSGEFARGSEHGVGVHVTDAGTYKGEFVNGQRSGCGLEVCKTGRRFMGTFQNDRRHGLALIQARGHKKGQVVLQRWEEGVLASEGADVTRPFVGGAAEAVAELAAAAFSSLAGMAEAKALVARQCAQIDEDSPAPPPLSALGLRFGRVQKNILTTVEGPVPQVSNHEYNAPNVIPNQYSVLNASEIAGASWK